MSTVSKVLQKKSGEVLSVAPDSNVFSAIEKMAEIAAGTALVMKGEQLVGILSERDFIRKIYLEEICGESTTVAEVMSINVLTVTPKDELERCMEIMTDERIRHLPVLEKNKVVGIISIGDIVKHMADAKAAEIKNLQNYITGPGL